MYIDTDLKLTVLFTRTRLAWHRGQHAEPDTTGTDDTVDTDTADTAEIRTRVTRPGTEGGTESTHVQHDTAD